MIIALTKKHPAARQLSTLAASVRAQRRGEPSEAPANLFEALNLTETSHGNNTGTYAVLPGRASSEDAIAAYRHVRKHYPQVLDILCHSAAHGVVEITVEIGTLGGRQDTLAYSQHDLLKIMPRILALFRGTVTGT